LLTPGEVAQQLERDARLLVAVGTTEQHGPHLPLGCDTIIVDRLADDLSAEFQVLRAPTLEFGVNARTVRSYPGSAGVRRKTLHRMLNDLVGAWEAGGVRQFIILTAHGQDPHQEALSTLRTRHASVRTVDIFAGEDLPVHGGEIDTSLLLHIDPELVDMSRASDFAPSARTIGRYHRGSHHAIPADSPGSIGWPTRATAERGAELYHLIYDRIARRVFGRAAPSPAGARCGYR
jgi:creatinine amidohydrolase